MNSAGSPASRERVVRKTLEDRFWSKTRRLANGCLEWTGAKRWPSARDLRVGGQSLPHGQFKYKGRKIDAHRMAKALELGCEPEDLPLIGHSCDYPPCVEQSHLTLSDPSKNLKEAYARGRRVLTGCCARQDTSAQ